MKHSKKNKIVWWSAILLTLTLTLSGCGSKADEGGSADQSKDQDTAKVTEIVVGTSGMPRPFTYINDKNELEGYDIDVVKAVFEELPQYKIAFEQTEFPSVLAGLDSDRYQVGANSFAMNEQRKEKYLFTNPIFQNQLVIAMADDRTDINSFDDLQGKSTEVKPGINYTTALETYNKTHADNPVNIVYSEAELAQVLQNIESGKYDFQLIDAAMLGTYIKEYGFKIKTVKLTEEETKLIGLPYTYLLLSKGPLGEQLQKDINSALDTLLNNGTLAEISTKYFGDDFSPKN